MIVQIRIEHWWISSKFAGSRRRACLKAARKLRRATSLLHSHSFSTVELNLSLLLIARLMTPPAP
eukprot:1965923-Amphidinium_carterae.1